MLPPLRDSEIILPLLQLTIGDRNSERILDLAYLSD